MDVLERLEKETPRAYQGFVDYCRMGSRRSLSNLLAVYEERTESAPTQSLRTLKEWSSKYGWVDRAREYDGQHESALELQIRRRKLRVLDQFGDLLGAAIAEADPRGASLSQIAGAVRTYLDGAMALADELPTHRVEVANVTDRTTEELRAEALRLIKRLRMGVEGNDARTLDGPTIDGEQKVLQDGGA